MFPCAKLISLSHGFSRKWRFYWPKDVIFVLWRHCYTMTSTRWINFYCFFFLVWIGTALLLSTGIEVNLKTRIHEVLLSFDKCKCAYIFVWSMFIIHFHTCTPWCRNSLTSKLLFSSLKTTAKTIVRLCIKRKYTVNGDITHFADWNNRHSLHYPYMF